MKQRMTDSVCWRISKCKACLLLAFAALVLLGGCMRYHPPEGGLLDDPDMRATCLETINTLYPESFQLVQRIGLIARNKQYDFVGYLAVDREHGFRAIAAGEMGGKVFDFLARGNDYRILLKPDAMPEKPLLAGVMGDIAHLFGSAADGQAAHLWRSSDGKLVLVVSEGDQLQEFAFDASGQNLTHSLEAENGKIVRRAFYKDYRLFPGWDRSLPEHIVIENYRWCYKLEIELLKFNAALELPNAFNAP